MVKMIKWTKDDKRQKLKENRFTWQLKEKYTKVLQG